MYIVCVCVCVFVYLYVPFKHVSFHLLTFWLYMERHYTNCVHLHNAPYFPYPIINQLVKLLRNCNTCESMTLHDCKDICTSKLPPQGNEDKYVAQ